MSTLGLRLAETCPHCGEPLEVLFRRDLNGGPLLAAVKHGLFMVGPWTVVTGLDDLPRLATDGE